MVDQSRKETQCVHYGGEVEAEAKGLNTPIFTSTSFSYLNTEKRLYPRYFNTPNQQVVADKVARLEKGEAGLVFGSGMAAISTTLYSLLKAGDHVVFQPGIYGGTFHLAEIQLPNHGINRTFAESQRVADLERVTGSTTRVLYLETPTNPLLSITDIEQAVKLAKSRNLITIMDNTFASPINQNPLPMGIDIVIHSATKYLGGHSDICAGVVVSSHALIGLIRETALNFGGCLDAVTCYQLEQSIKTLAVRVGQQNRNAGEIAQFLERQPQTQRVNYPGLRTHPGHEIAKKQMTGFGGMLSFELKNQDGTAFQKKLRLIRPSMSLGAVESTICAPATTSHLHLTPQQRAHLGISDQLLRLSVGIEDSRDLIADLSQALT